MGMLYLGHAADYRLRAGAGLGFLDMTIEDADSTLHDRFHEERR